MMLLLDASGSMAEPAAGGVTKIEAAREGLGEVIEALPAETEVGLRVFGAQVRSLDEPGACEDSQRVVDLGVGNRDALREAVDGYQPFGETPIGYALQQAASDLGQDGHRSIVLVSDGLATCDPDPCVVAAELVAQGFDLRIDVVGLAVDEAARAQLRCIAAAGNGTYADAASAEEIVLSVVAAAERAVRPFEMAGTPVHGSGDPESAPVIRAGDHVDTPRESSEDAARWYRIERSIPGSTVMISHYEMTPGSRSSVFFSAESETGEACDLGPRPVGHPIFTGYTRFVAADAANGCDGDLLVQARFMRAAGEGGEFGISIAEEPPLVAEPTAPADVAGPGPVELSTSTEQITTGSSFDDAAEIAPGQTYASTLVPGEVQAFRVPVGWGQRLVVRIDTPGLTPEQSDAMPGFRSMPVQILTPLRSSVDDSVDGAGLPTSASLGDEPQTRYAATEPIAWASRLDDEGSTAAIAGRYFVVIAADFDSTSSFELPFTITAQAQGEVRGAPEYVDGQSVLLEAPDPTATPEASPSATATPAASTESSPSPAVPVAIGIAAVLLGIGAWLLLRRRSRGSSAG